MAWHFRKSNSSTFKNLQTLIQGPRLFLRIFQALQIWKKNSKTFKDFQGPIRALHSINPSINESMYEWIDE